MLELEWVSNRLVTNQPQIDQVAEVLDVLPVDQACDGKTEADCRSWTARENNMKQEVGKSDELSQHIG